MMCFQICSAAVSVCVLFLLSWTLLFSIANSYQGLFINYNCSLLIALCILIDVFLFN